jgi:hypothetical protein
MFKASRHISCQTTPARCSSHDSFSNLRVRCIDRSLEVARTNSCLPSHTLGTPAGHLRLRMWLMRVIDNTVDHFKRSRDQESHPSAMSECESVRLTSVTRVGTVEVSAFRIATERSATAIYALSSFLSLRFCHRSSSFIIILPRLRNEILREWAPQSHKQVAEMSLFLFVARQWAIQVAICSCASHGQLGRLRLYRYLLC